METAAQNGNNGHEAGDHRSGQRERETIKAHQLVISAWEGTEAFTQEVTRLWQERGYRAKILSDAEGFENADSILDLAFASLAAEFFGQQTSDAPLLLEQLAQSEAATNPRSVVVVPGGMDVARFTNREAIPLQFGRRRVIEGPDNSLLMRADVSESALMGRLLAEKINQTPGELAVCLPLRGLSQWDRPGEPLYSMEANMALFGNMTTHLRRDIRLYDSNVHINDPAFAVLCVDTLLALTQKEHPQNKSQG